MSINKLIYNQTEGKVKVNNFILLPGTEININSTQVDIYHTHNTFYRLIDNVISNYAITGEFVIYLTDQHGFVDRPYFSDTTVFMSVDTGKSCMYLAKTNDPIIDPPIFFYGRDAYKPQKKNRSRCTIS